MNQRCLDAMAGTGTTARGAEFRDVMADLNSDFVTLLISHPQAQEKTHSWAGDDDYKVMAVSGSGTAAMEMIIANRFRPNDLVLVPTNGKFGERVAEMCKRFCKVKHIRYDWGRAFDLYELEQQLERKCYEAVLICHNETSSGITQMHRPLLKCVIAIKLRSYLMELPQ